jgi:hypothetical protein
MCPSEVTNITGDCDLFTQDCPQTNQTCTFVDDGTGNTKTSCMLANGLKGVGQTCASDGECQAHLFCIGDPGTCTPACCPDTDEPCNGGQCNLTVNVQAGPSQGELHFMACTYGMACALFDPSVCPGSEDCHLSGPAFAVCSQPSPTPVGEGEACMYVNDCGESQICVGPDIDNSVCRYLCEIGDTTSGPGLGSCPANQFCDGSFDTGYPNVGLCQPN